MTVTVILNQEEVSRAIQAWLDAKGYVMQGQPTFVYPTTGDRREDVGIEARCDVNEQRQEQ